MNQIVQLLKQLFSKYWIRHCPECSRTINLEDFVIVLWLMFLEELAFT